MIACGFRIHVLPSEHDEVYRLFRGLLEPARVRGGCLACGVSQDLEGPEVLALVQEWAS
jgi:quinol monooxygenase YgiN